MTKRLELPKFQAFDGNGDPLSGGLVYTYDAGTTTAKTTYSDYDASTPNANPVVLDSRGEADIYVQGSYKIVLKDSADVTIWTLDNVKGGLGSDAAMENYYYPENDAADQGVTGDSDTIKYAVDTISTDSGAIYLRHDSGSATTTYTLTTSETIPENINLVIENGAIIDGAGTLTVNSPEQISCQLDQQIFGSSITVTFSEGGEVSFEWFGATGDATTDDSTAIQAAYDSLSIGGVIKMLARTYRVVSQILVNGTYINHKTVGVGGTTFNESSPYNGSTFYCNASSVTFFLFDGNGAVEHSGPIFEHVNFVGSSKTSTTLLELESVNRWTLRNVSFRGADVGLSTLDTDGDASWGYISQPIVKDCNTGFDLNSSVSMYGGDIEPASSGIGIQIANDWSSSKIIGVKFDGASAATGVYISGYRNIVSSCIFEGCDPAVYMDHDAAGHALSGDDNKVIGCTIFGSDGTETGITVESDANRSQLIGNYFGNLTTNVDDSGDYTVRIDNERLDYGVQTGLLSHDTTGYWENFVNIKGTGSYPYLDLTDTDASGHQYRIRTYLSQLQLRDETAGNSLIRIVDGANIYLGETSNPTGIANVGLLYTKDNGAGKTQLCVIFGTGATQVIATEP